MDSFDNDVRVPQLRDIRVLDPDHPRHYNRPVSEIEDANDQRHNAPSTLNLVPQQRRPQPKRRNVVSWNCRRASHGRYQIISNILIVSFAFVLNFTAFQSMQALQSSLNREDGLGPISLSVIYATLILSALFLPSILIKKLGCKWTMAFCMVPYIGYMAANFYATWWTIIPAAAILGVAAAPLWTAQCTYFTLAANQYATLTSEAETAVKSRFFGIFFTAFQSTVIWGNLIAAFLLHDAPTSDDLFAGVSKLGTQNCGAFYCSEKDVVDNLNLDRPNIIKVYTLCGTYVGLGILGMLTIVFLLDKQPYEDPALLDDLAMVRSPSSVQRTSSRNSQSGVVTSYLGKPESPDEIWYPGRGRQRIQKKTCLQKCSNCCALLLQTVYHLRYLDQVLLIPITVFSGLEQAFLAADFTKMYVSCSLGIWAIGLVLICYGASDMIFSLLVGHIMKYTGRLPLFITGALVHCALIVGLFVWHPSSDQLIWFFLLAAFWGLSDAIWQTQVNALYSILFADRVEAAFSNYKLWESTGFIISFLYSSYICVAYKIIILLSVLTLGMLGYMIVEFRASRIRIGRLFENETENGHSRF